MTRLIPKEPLNKFKECSECATKAGSPTLCEPAIVRLEGEVKTFQLRIEKIESALKRIAACKNNPDPFGYLPAIAAEALDKQKEQK